MPDPQVNLTHSDVTIGATSAQVVAANAGRKYLLVQNDHATQTLWLKFGAAAVVNEGIRVGAGEAREFSPAKWNNDPRVLNGIASGAGTVVLVSEA